MRYLRVQWRSTLLATALASGVWSRAAGLEHPDADAGLRKQLESVLAEKVQRTSCFFVLSLSLSLSLSFLSVLFSYPSLSLSLSLRPAVSPDPMNPSRLAGQGRRTNQ